VHGDGSRRGPDQGGRAPVEGGGTGRPTLNAAVRRRRADRAFYLRLAGAMRQQERALERLKR